MRVPGPPLPPHAPGCSCCLSFVQRNGNVSKSEEFLQWHKHEFGERRGRRKGDGTKPSVPLKRELAADMIEVTNQTFDPVLLQAEGLVRVNAPTEPASGPDEQVMGQRAYKHQEALGFKAFLVAFGDAQSAFILSSPKLVSMPPPRWS